MAAAKKAEHHPALAFARSVGSMTGDRQGIDGAIGMSDSALRVRQGRGAEDDIDHAQNGFGIASHGTWARSGNHQTIGQHKVHRIQHAGVGWDIREHMFEGYVTGGYGSGTRNIHGTSTLR